MDKKITQLPQVPGDSVSVQNSVPSSHSNSPLIIGIIALLVILGVGGVFLSNYFSDSNRSLPVQSVPLVTSTPVLNPTANWKTYRNTEFLFSFQYPQQMTIEEGLKKDLYYTTVAKLVMENYGVSVRVIHDIDIYNKMISKEVAKREIMDSGFEYDLVDLKVNGLSITKTLVNDPAKRTIITIAHPTKNLFIEISMTGINHQLDDKILSTFKLLDQQVTDITNWKTYTNDFAKFSLKYPSDMTISEKSFTEILRQVTIKGKEGDLTINIDKITKGNSPGWGGGCDPQYHVTKSILNQQNEFCEGEAYISGIYLSSPDKTFAYQVNATILSPYPENKDIMFRIISTITFLNQQTMDTSSWKTFTNTKYNYSIKYPGNLFTKGLETDNQLTFTESIDGQWLYALSAEDNSKGLTLDTIKQQELDKLGISPADIQSEIKDVSTQNAIFQTIYVTSAKEKRYAIAIAYTIKGNTIYYFRANSNKEQFDQILSTFKFSQ